MIIVTGEPRSGTSLTMEICRLLGVPVWGNEQPIIQDDEQRKEKAKYLNEKFWEVPYVVTAGIQLNRLRRQMQALSGEPRDIVKEHIKEIYKNDSSAVKIIWSGLIKTDHELLNKSKILLCVRNPYHVATSQQNLESGVKVAGEYKENPAFVTPLMPFTAVRYLQNVYRFAKWALIPANKELEMLLVDFDHTLDHSNEQISRIAAFLGVESFDMDSVAACIKQNKRRSAIDNPYTEEDWIIADEAYQLLKEGEYQAIVSRLEDYRKQRLEDPENTTWLDEETFFPIKADLYRRMQEKLSLLENMKNSKQRRENANSLCLSCPLYNRDGESYTIKTPYDIPDITRNRIDCVEQGPVTLEQCQQHWSQIRGNKVWREKHGLPVV